MTPHERVDEVMHAAFDMKSPRAFVTPHGTVQIARVEEGDGCVEVFLGGEPESGETHFRIFNPPTMSGGKLDPLQAVAEAIARHGGAQSTRKGRR